MILPYQMEKLLMNIGKLWSTVMLLLFQKLLYMHFLDLLFLRYVFNDLCKVVPLVNYIKGARVKL